MILNSLVKWSQSSFFKNLEKKKTLGSISKQATWNKKFKNYDIYENKPIIKMIVYIFYKKIKVNNF